MKICNLSSLNLLILLVVFSTISVAQNVEFTKENFKDQKEESKEDDEEKEELEDDGQPVRLLSPNERHKLQGLFAQNPHKMDDNAYLTLYTATNKDYPMLLKKYAA